MRIPCPYCGLRDHSEFSYEGDATVSRPAAEEADLEVWMDFIFYRDNPYGPHDELWHHNQGCRQWLRVRRDTRNHEILSVEDVRHAKAPAASGEGEPS